MNKIVLTALAIFFAFNVVAQSIKKVGYSWKKPDKFVEIPAAFAKEDVVIIYNERSINNYYEIANSIETYSTQFFKRKIRILTKDGLEEYTKLKIRKAREHEVLFLDVRTIKPTGKTFGIKSEDIILQKAYDDEGDFSFDQYSIAVPNVEVGDEVEYVYAVNLNNIISYGEILLHQESPCLQSTFTYKVKQGLITDLFWSKEMIEPIKSKDEDVDAYFWKMENLPGLKDQNYSIENRELPSVTFNINKYQMRYMDRPADLGLTAWSDLYKVSKRWMYDNAKTPGLDAYFESNAKSLEGKSKLEIVQFYNAMVNDNFEILDRVDESNKLKPIKFYMEQKSIDFRNLYLFYKYMLEHYKIPFKYCYSRSKYSGELLQQVIADDQITHYFFNFNDVQDHFLFVSNDDRKYYVDERPFQLENAKIIQLVKTPNDESAVPSIDIFKVSEIPMEANKRQMSMHLTLNGVKDSVMIEGKIKYTGYITNIVREEWTEKLKDNKEKEIAKMFDWDEKDLVNIYKTEITSSEKKYPFAMDMKFNAAQKIELTQVDPTTVSLNLHNYFENHRYRSEDEARILDLYLPYKKTDEIVLFFESDKPIEIINKSEFETHTANEIGGYTMLFEQVTDKVIKITSTYQIKKTNEPKENYKFLQELNEAAKKYAESSLLIKTK